MMASGLSCRTASTVVGVHRSTIARWLYRAARGEAVVRPGGVLAAQAETTLHEEAIHLVHELHGLIGVESLRHAVCGLTRGQAKKAKREARRQMESERREEAQRITVLSPGVVRGFDAMDLHRVGHLLVSADAAVPYRTRWAVVPRYNAEATTALLEADFRANGAPLVMRLDRASQHDAPAVGALLREHEVLSLHGPPYYPRYYGQLERQNREHRAWLTAVDLTLSSDPTEAVERMMQALNGHWHRRSLGWRTARQAWDERTTLRIDRAEFREEVFDRAERIRRRLTDRCIAPTDLPERLAIEHTLVRRGLLRRKVGGWC